jgi:putative hydroxymethylpyrimidine transport system substrate-binding protein
MKLFRWLVVVGVAIFLAGCGGGSDGETAEQASDPPKPEPELREVRVTLDGLFRPEVAGLLTANHQGLFEDAGFIVHVTAPSPPTRPVRYVAERTVDMAVSHPPQVALAREKGIPIVALGSLVSQSTTSMIWLEKSGVDDVADLRGKTIAFQGLPFEEAFLKAVLRRAGLTPADVKIKQTIARAQFKLVPELASGRADAIFGGTEDAEGVELEARGLKPVVTPIRELGVPDYDELVVIARRDRVAKEPELFRRFMATVRQGTAAAIEDPEAATEAVIAGLEGEGYDEVDRSTVEAGVEATLPLLSRTGRIDQAQEKRLLDWMRAEGILGG